MDAIDAGHLEQAVLSRGYQLITLRVQEMLSQKMQALTSDLNPLATAKARGTIEALRTVLEIPAILQREHLAGRRKVEAIR